MPASSPAAHIYPTVEPSSGVRPRKARVLVIDDEIAICRSLDRLLSREYDVTVECDSRRAAAIAATGNWDVVFCDLMMPGLTGMDLYEGLATTRPDVARRIVFMTAGSFSTRSGEFLETTENLHLSKPFDPPTLRKAMLEVLGRGYAEEESANRARVSQY